MNDDGVLAIVNLCLAINRRASEIYVRLSETCNEELRRFWLEMASEEKSHTAFWSRVKAVAEEHKLPYIFDDPVRTRNELERLSQKAEALLIRWETTKSMGNAFVLAYRLEFYMLHPAFEILYHTLKPLVGEIDPEAAYDIHINRFIEMFVRYGEVTPELELLGETLQSLRQRNKVLARLVTIDSLTGLLNRRGFFFFAKQLACLAQRNGENMGVLVIDIDNFKGINDKHGHPKGDEVLKGVAGSLKTNIRKSDIAGRYGGEEFAVLFPAIQPDALPQIAEAIRHGIEVDRTAGIPVTVSIGAAQGVIQADPDTELYSWIAKADERLYAAKTSGKNCVVYRA